MTSLERKHNQQGFTIVELLIATAILATIVLLVTVIMINIDDLYYKSVAQSSAQDNVRGIADQLSQDLKYNSGNVIYGSASTGGTTINAYCVGSYVRYSFITGSQIGSAAAPQVLWRDSSIGDTYALTPTTGSCPPIDLLNSSDVAGDQANEGGSEILDSNSWLTAFCLNGYSTTTNTCTYSSPASPYSLSIGVAYGPSDSYTSGLLSGTGLATVCSGGGGFQFCGTASLTSSVVQRLINGSDE